MQLFNDFFVFDLFVIVNTIVAVQGVAYERTRGAIASRKQEHPTSHFSGVVCSTTIPPFLRPPCGNEIENQHCWREHLSKA